jgi:hypothetical protein
MTPADRHQLNLEMIRACREGETKKVQELVTGGCHVHYNDDMALRSAAALGHHEIVAFLLEKGATKGAYSHEALREAGNPETRQVLLKAYKNSELKNLLKKELKVTGVRTPGMTLPSDPPFPKNEIIDELRHRTGLVKKQEQTLEI